MSDSHPDKSTRVLSCVLCQQRKIKCDRTFPCTNCTKSQAQCVPAGLLPRHRKRRFPERELLNRVRQYETLLKRHNIEFNPLHSEPPKEGDERQKRRSVESEDWLPSSSASPRPKLSKESYDTKYKLFSRFSRKLLIFDRDFWNAMNQTCPQSDDEADSPPPTMTEEVIKKAWDQGSGLCDPLFGGRADQIDVSSHHPEASQIFRLWQVYLDNVDPLLKITHTPTLQARIIEAITNLKQVSPQLEVLMFGIYCIAIGSLMSDECQELLGAPREELLSQYQRSCREALVRCEFLRSDKLDCLTGLYFYLVSLRPVLGDPRTLSSMLGIAVRSAQRMGLHSESACCRYPPLEAELRRRLWWALVLFDTRVAEMAAYRTPTLSPLWDCKIPSNVNDFDLQPEMKEAPEPQGQSSEAVFVVVRSVMGDFLRNSSFHLDFTCPPLKAIARDIRDKSNPEASELDTLENLLVQRYLRPLNPDNPLHFITIWMTRGMLAKCRLFDYYSKYAGGSYTKAQRDTAISFALETIDCDTKILLNPSASRYLWLVHFHFPFPAYIHILQDLRRRPLSRHSEKCWASMSDNFEARSLLLHRMSPRLLVNTMTAVLFQAWEATESALKQSGQEPVTPKIITIGRELVALNQASQAAEKPSSGGSAVWPTSMNPDPLSLMGMGGQYGGAEMWMPFDLPAPMSGTNILSPSDWSLINWGM